MTAFADRELAELLRDRPDLAAIADAVFETQRPRSKWLRVTKSRGAGLAAALAAAFALALLAPWEARGPSVIDRALAAVGGGEVIHAVVEYSWPQDVVVNLATGAEQERVHRYEYWYDDSRGLLHDRLSADGGPAIDQLGAIDSGRLDPALAGFATRYREALANGDARVVGDTDVGGRSAKRIEFAPRGRDGSGAVEEVTVDAETFVPLTFHSTYPPNGRRSPEWRVVTIESVPRDPANFTLPKSPPRLEGGEVTEARSVSLADARRALGAQPLGLGRTPDSVALSDTTAELSDGRKVSGVLVRLAYGDVHVSLARDDAGSYAIGFGEGEFPTPPRGSVALTGNDAAGWFGELRRDGFAVMVTAPTKARVLDATRQLRPLGQ
jgi:hypothetical protein